AEDGIRDATVTGVQTCALPISKPSNLGTFRSDSQRSRGWKVLRRSCENGLRAGTLGSRSLPPPLSAIRRRRFKLGSVALNSGERSEERRVGNERRWRWAREPEE